MMRNNRISLLFLGFLVAVLLIPLPAIAQELAGNDVNVKFSNTYTYETDSSKIANVPLELKKHWFIDIVNVPDGGTPLLNPKVQLYANSQFDYLWPNDPSILTIQPGLYTWYFKGLEVVEPASLAVSAWPTNNIELAKPRFNMSRSVEPETLSGDTTTQTVNVMFKLEEPLSPEINNIHVIIGSRVEAYKMYNLVESYYVSQLPVEDWNMSDSNNNSARWYASPSNIKVGKTYTFQATLLSTKSAELLGNPIYKPFVVVIYSNKQDQPTVTSNSLPLSDPANAASVTISADNTVDWRPEIESIRYDFSLKPFVSEITPPPAPFRVIVNADVRIEPETLNTDSKGVISVFIKLPEQYTVNNIKMDTVKCNGAYAIKGSLKDERTLIAKFRRQDLGNLESTVLEVTGEFNDGSIFKGKDTLKKIK